MKCGEQNIIYFSKLIRSVGIVFWRICEAL